MTRDAAVSTPVLSHGRDVLPALEAFCDALPSGERIPTHTELMRRFNASERAVRWALDELRRDGRIIRRQGAGTFLADRRPIASETPIPTNNRTIVAVALPDRSFFDRCVDLLYRQADAADLTLLLRPVDPRVEAAIPMPTPTAPDQPLGYLFFSYRHFGRLARQAADSGARVVVVGAPHADQTPAVPCVYGDHNQGAYLATKHLIDIGHRRIAFIGDEMSVRTYRWHGHQRALHEAARQNEPIVSRQLDLGIIGRWGSRPEDAAAYFSDPDAPTGMVVWNDHEAVQLISVLTRAGLRVPEDISVVGYDALPEGEVLHPRLTTVDHGIGPQLQAAIDLLTRPIPPPPSHSVVVLPTLVVRESTRPFSRTDAISAALSQHERG